MKQHSLYSASASHRWIHCPGSVVLSKDIENVSSEAAEEGTRAHELAERILRGETVECDDAEMLQHVQYYVDYVKSIPGELRIEQRIDYSDFLGVDDAFGTADAVIVDDDVVHIVDFKYGKGKVKAEGNTQLFLYGSVFLPKQLKLHIVQPRIDWVDVWEPDNIEELSNQLKDAASEVLLGLNGDSTRFNVGQHCYFCQAKAICRAYHDETLKDFDFDDPDTLSIEELAEIKTKSKKIRDYLDAVDSFVLRRALQGEIVPGWIIGEGRSGNRKWIGAVEEVLGDKAYKTELRSPGEIEKILPRKSNKELWEELDRMIEKPPGKQVLVPVDPTSEFENME